MDKTLILYGKQRKQLFGGRHVSKICSDEQRCSCPPGHSCCCSEFPATTVVPQNRLNTAVINSSYVHCAVCVRVKLVPWRVRSIDPTSVTSPPTYRPPVSHTCEWDAMFQANPKCFLARCNRTELIASIRDSEEYEYLINKLILYIKKMQFNFSYIDIFAQSRAHSKLHTITRHT